MTYLGVYQFGNATRQIKAGQVRMLILGRSREGYALERTNASLDQALPHLQDGHDPLIDSAKILLSVEESRDRARKVKLLLDGLQAMNGPAAVPLLASCSVIAPGCSNGPDGNNDRPASW